jgi:hypothetical protein
VKEKKAQEVKSKTRLAKGTTELTVQQIYDYAIFELAVHPFDSQSGRRDAFENQREYMRRDPFMGKLNPEKFSRRLHEINKYVDVIPMGKIQKMKKTYCEGIWQSLSRW